MSVESPVDAIVIGKIIGAYGILGWVKVISFTNKSDDIFNYSPWFISYHARWKLIKVDNWRVTRKCYLVKIFDIFNRDIAMSLAQSELIIDANRLPSLCNNEYYWKDIIGCKVITINGYSVGCIINIIESIAHDILVIRVEHNGINNNRDCLIPFVEKEIIKDVDLIAKLIIVDWDV